ncbi:vesicle-associated membrane protein-associated protein A [Drosophila nasuta]|uniref:vesicle-associated membrane protein-associated protein A n=1 Tax=Drosophila nasuta TaxID=42062 RepID=UPI00295EFFB3|nr:vesicle-associated membrane protein-associated protein A [Drosophila nasuta]
MTISTKKDLTMNTSEGVLIVDPPEELLLEGPFNRAICKKLLVHNPGKKLRMAFKLKTTTPRLFFVRPNVGVVKPGETCNIDIFVHPISENENTQRHKFLLLATTIDGEVPDLHQYWRNLDPAKANEIKIKIKFVEQNTTLTEACLRSPINLVDSMEGNVDREESDPLANLLNQVHELEEERKTLSQKVEALDKANAQIIINKKKRNKVLYVILTMLFAFIAYFMYETNYM